MLPSFTPTRFNGAFETWDLEQLMHAAITHRVGGDWWVSVSRPSDKEYLEVSGVIENVQSDLIRALKTGSLQTFVHMPGDDLFYRVPPAIWDSTDADGYLAGSLYRGVMDGAYHRNIPDVFLDKPLLVLDADAKVWIGGPDVKKLSRGPKTIFNWREFENEAVRILWDEGGFHEGWLKSALHAQLELWCNRNWQRTPSRTSIQEHLNKAEARFLAEKAAI